MNYGTYCKKNKIAINNPASAKMYYFYKEASEASTDMKKEEMFSIPYNAVASIQQDMMSMVCYPPIQSPVTFAPLNCPQVCEKTVPCQAKGNKPMYIDNDKHIESSKINYLTDRASNVYYTKESGLSKTFGFVNDDAPSTPAELVKRIQDGKFVLRKETEDKQSYDPSRYITWRDPSVKEDKDGLIAARRSLEIEYQNVKDAVALSTHPEALTAIKALESWQPTGAAS